MRGKHRCDRETLMGHPTTLAPWALHLGMRLYWGQNPHPCGAPRTLQSTEPRGHGFLFNFENSPPSPSILFWVILDPDFHSVVNTGNLRDMSRDITRPIHVWSG